jgi:hypothetical protein
MNSDMFLKNWVHQKSKCSIVVPLSENWEKLNKKPE